MDLHFDQLNVFAVVASVVAGQVLSTLWFTVLFGDAWAREYGVESRQEHTKQVPGYTYGVQLACTVALTLSLALLQAALGVDSLGQAMGLGAVVALGFCVATGLPGQAFLKRWRAAGIALGSQVMMILVISGVLGAWG